MQLLKILAVLSNLELTELEQKVHAAKRESLVSLFKELKKYRSGKLTFEKEKVFKKVFGKSFQPTDEDKWKYEVRTLKKLTYKFLAETAFNEALKNDESLLDEWVLTMLLKRQVNDVFEQELERTLKNKENRLSNKRITKLLELKSKHSQDIFHRSPMSDDEHELVLNEIRDRKILQLANDQREINVGYAALLRRKVLKKEGLTYSNNTVLKLEPIDKIVLSDHQNKLSVYFDHLRNAQLYRGKERLNAIKEALSHIDEIAHELETPQQFKASLLHNVMATYYAECEYENALEYGYLLSEHLNKCRLSYNGSVLSAIMRIKLALKNYSGVVDFYELHEQALRKEGNYHLSTLYLSYALLHLNNYKAAIKAMVGSEAAFRQNEAHPVRFVFIIAAIMDKDRDMAKRELASYKANNTLPKKASSHLVVDAFERYLDAQQKKASIYLSELRSIETYMIVEGRTIPGESLPFQWLQQYIMHEVKQLADYHNTHS